jgi:hypothetical protein
MCCRVPMIGIWLPGIGRSASFWSLMPFSAVCYWAACHSNFPLYVVAGCPHSGAVSINKTPSVHGEVSLG